MKHNAAGVGPLLWVVLELTRLDLHSLELRVLWEYDLAVGVVTDLHVYEPRHLGLTQTFSRPART